MNKRRSELDFAKGVGIVLMVLGHSYSKGNGEGIVRWLYSFHMPLFFIVSGIIKRSAGEKPLSGILRARFWNLLIPYYVWGIIAAGFLSIIGRRPLDYFFGCIASVAGFTGLSALWFLPCLCFAEIFFWLNMRLQKAGWQFGAVFAGLMLIIGLYVEAPNALVTVVLRSTTGVSLMYLGWMLAKRYSCSFKRCGWLALGGLHLVMCSVNGTVSLASREYGNGFLYYFNALLGTWLVVQAYQHIPSRRLADAFAWFGRNSLILVCTSQFPIEVIRILDYKLFGNILPTLGTGEGVVMCLLVIAAEAAFIPFANRYLWFMFGKKSAA